MPCVWKEQLRTLHCLLYLDILWNTGVRDARGSPACLLKTFFLSTVSANLFSVTGHPLLRAVFKLRTCRLPGLESIPGGVQGTSGTPGYGTPGSGLLEKVGITHRLDSMALKDFSNLNKCVCFLLFFLNNIPFFFLSTWCFSDYPDFKKLFYFSPPPQRHWVY